MQDPESAFRDSSGVGRTLAAPLGSMTGVSVRRAGVAVALCLTLPACSAETTRKAAATARSPAVMVSAVRIEPAAPRYAPERRPQESAITPTRQPRTAGFLGAGLASWYGDRFHGRPTANGERYDMASLSAAHPTLPLPSYVRVTNVQNGRSVVVRVNDRGPFHRGRLIDVSRRTADVLGFRSSGVGNVKVDFVGPAPAAGDDERTLIATYQEFGRSSTPSDTRMAGLRPVSDAEIAHAATSQIARSHVAAPQIFAPHVASRGPRLAAASPATARAAPASLPPAPIVTANAATPPTAFAAAPIPLPLASMPSPVRARPVATAARAPTDAHTPDKRVIEAAEPVLAATGPSFASRPAPTASAPVGVRDPMAASRIAASFESFAASAPVATDSSPVVGAFPAVADGR